MSPFDLPARMEDENFEKYDLEESLRKHFYDGKPSQINKDNVDEDLRVWLSSLLEEGQVDRYKDVTFAVGHDEHRTFIKAHRLVLTTRSKEFEQMLEISPDPNVPVEVNDIDPEAFKTIIYFVYTGQAPFPKKVMATVDLMQASKKYGIQALYNLIKLFLQRQIPKVKERHFIMIAQKVLDHGLEELEPDCMKKLQEDTEDVMKDDLFMKVSPNFIKRLLSLDSFHDINEIDVFWKIVQWASLRKGHLDTAAEQPPVEYAITRPNVRDELDPFMYDFRFASVSKTDLASIAHNSGLLMPKEQLRICYYLLEQRPDLGEFSMKLRGKNQRSKKMAQRASSKIVDDHGHLHQEPVITKNGTNGHVYHASPVVVLETYSENKKRPAEQHKTINDLYPQLNHSKSDHHKEVNVAHNGSDKESHSMKSESKEHKATNKDQSSGLMDRWRNKFGGDKRKANGKHKTSRVEKEVVKVKRTASMNVDAQSSSSSSSSSSSRSSSPRPLNRAATQPDLSTSATNINEKGLVTTRSKGTLTDRPKSMIVDDPKSLPASINGSVGKKAASKNGLAGLFKKASPPENGRPRSAAGGHSSKPMPPPRVKSTGMLVDGEVEAEI